MKARESDTGDMSRSPDDPAADDPAADAPAAADSGADSPADADDDTDGSGLADVSGREFLAGLDRTTRGVLALVAVALVARLAYLGSRVSHFDEGRVAWWADYFLETGSFTYRPIIHGPLVQHVNAGLFAVAGANDFTMRLFVALVGGLLPLAALLFREHLESDEILGVAFFLSLNPLLVYYSRFFRSSIPVAAFALVTFGLFVRAYDKRSVRPLYYAAVFAALMLAAKENAAVYLLCWIGGSALLIDHALFRSGDDQSGADWVVDRVRVNKERIDRVVDDPLYYLGHVVLVGFVFGAVTLYFYAPRSPGTAEIGFWEALGSPLKLPDLIGTTVDDITAGYESWFGKSSEAGERGLVEQYMDFFETARDALKQSALALSVLSVFGFVVERYGRGRPRFLVMFAGYWGFVSVIGYPLGTDIANAWIMVNALVPLAIPAGVGLAYVTREARDSLGGDPIRFAITVFILFLIVGQMTFALADGVYLNPTSDKNDLVQYAQPADDFRPDMRFVENQPDHDGVDVLFVGSPYVRDQPRFGGMDPKCLNIGNALPLHWYVEIYDADVACEQRISTAVANLSEHDPLVVVVADRGSHQIADDLEGYEVETHRLRAWGRETAFFTSKTGFAGNASAG